MQIRYIPLLFITILFSACTSTHIDKSLSLDQAIREAAEHINNQLEAGSIVAILNFDSPTEAFSRYVLDEIIHILVNSRKLRVVERNQLDLIRQEKGLHYTGEIGDEHIQAIGKELGAQAIVSGSIVNINKVYRFRIRTFGIEKAEVLTSTASDIASSDDKTRSLLAEVRPTVEPITTGTGTRPTTPTSAPVVQPTPAPVVQPTPAPRSAPQSTPTSPVRSVVPEMVWISGGTFTMGSPANESGRSSDEGPQRRVTVSAFYLGKYEVTQKEYQEIMGTNPSSFKGDNLPIERVTWFDAIEYCNRLSWHDGLIPAYTINGTNIIWNRNANGYRLPTEAEWEYACRAGTTTPFSTGNTITTSQANFNGSRTTQVGSFAPNAWGLYDMHGNVWEWCWDWYSSPYNVSDVNNPAGPSTGTNRVYRGGSWLNTAAVTRSAFRSTDTPALRYGHLGFRLVRP